MLDLVNTLSLVVEWTEEGVGQSAPSTLESSRLMIEGPVVHELAMPSVRSGPASPQIPRAELHAVPEQDKSMVSSSLSWVVIMGLNPSAQENSSQHSC